MTNLKRALAVLMILAVAAFFFSCSKDEEAAPAAAAPEAAPAETVSVEDAVEAYFTNMPDHIYKIGQADFLDLVAAGEEMTILDIRKADDYAAGHIQGAVNLPWGSSALVDELANIPQEGNIFLYCYSGQTAGQAVALMNMVGIPVRSVNLGYVYGISRVEGYEAYVTTDAATLPAANNDIDDTLMAAYADYYADMAEAAGTTFASNIVSEANAKAILDAADPDVVFVSIRQQDAYDAGHIEGASLIPFGGDMYDDFASLPADKKIIIYCYSGQTAGQTVAMLRVLGYDAVSLKGGMGVGANAPLGWSNQGFPVVASN